MFVLIGITSCGNGRVDKEQLNNNGSGADRDITIVQPDTMAIDEQKIRDTNEVSVQSELNDSTSNK